MSIIRANKIKEKIIERRGNEFLDQLKGLEFGGLALMDSYDLSWHLNVEKKNSAFNSVAKLLSPIEDSGELVIKEFEDFIGEYGSEFLAGFERPFIFNFSVIDPRLFIQSFNNARGTKDIVIFCKFGKAVFEVQELEYEVKIFSEHA